MQIGGDIVGDGPENWFGDSISMTADGKTIVVASPLIDNSTGRTIVFRYNSSAVAWEKLGQDLYGESRGDLSGIAQGVSIASSGDIIAIGARDNDSIPEYNSGHVRIYRYDSDTLIWEQMGDDLDGEKAGDGFGNGVALSQDGSHLVVGAPYNDDKGNRSGQVKVFSYDSVSQAWQQVGPTVRGTSDDELGRVVSISSDGMIIAAGAPHIYEAVLSSFPQGTGRVKVFQYSKLKDDWEQMGGDIMGEAASDWFGSAISMTPSGNIIAVGAPYNDGNGIDSGRVTVYEYNADVNDWVQFGDIKGQNSKDYLWSVALSSDGKTIVVGSSYNSDGGLYWRGNARIFHHSSSTDLWNQVGGDIQGPNAYAMSGREVSISSDGSIVAVPTPNAADGFFSAVRVFIRDSCPAPSSMPSNFPTKLPSSSPSAMLEISPSKSKKTKAPKAPKSKKGKNSPIKAPKAKKNTKAPKAKKNTIVH